MRRLGNSIDSRGEVQARTEAEPELTLLPIGWDWLELGDLVVNPKNDIVDGPFGSNLKASEYENHGVPIIRLQNIDRNSFLNKNIRFISHQKAAQLKRHSFSKNDIVITLTPRIWGIENTPHR